MGATRLGELVIGIVSENLIASIALVLSLVSLSISWYTWRKGYKTQILHALYEIYLTRLRDNEKRYNESVDKLKRGRVEDPFERENEELVDAAKVILEYLEDETHGMPIIKFPNRTAQH